VFWDLCLCDAVNKLIYCGFTASMNLIVEGIVLYGTDVQ